MEFSEQSLLLLLFFVFMLLVSWKDIRRRRIPNKLVGIFFLVFMGYQLIVHPENIMDSIIGSGAGGVFLLLAHLLNPKGMGMGDVKLMAVIGLVVGWTGVAITILLACLVGSVLGITLIRFRRMSWKDTLPFGAILSPSAFITLALDWHKDFWNFLISMV